MRLHNRDASSQRRPPANLLVSVVVPTKDRPKALAKCIEGLAAQTIADQLEVVVVDDGSLAGDAVTAVAERRRAKVLQTRGRGPAAARNAGARQAAGVFLCFIDDDCVPEPEWAERLVEALQRGADAAAGTTVNGSGVLGEASELVARAPARESAAPASRIAFAPSNNLACARSVIEAIPFDESYPTAAGEDRDWCARIAARGYTLRRQADAVLVHQPNLTLMRFVCQQLRYGEGAWRFRRREPQRRLESPTFYASLIRLAFRKGFRVGLLVSLAQVATAAGFAIAAARARWQPSPLTTAGGGGS
jgi:glycosyltransferase involved in cell wall biosynthesis